MHKQNTDERIQRLHQQISLLLHSHSCQNKKATLNHSHIPLYVRIRRACSYGEGMQECLYALKKNSAYTEKNRKTLIVQFTQTYHLLST